MTLSAAWYAHGSTDAVPVLLMLVPAAALYGFALIIIFMPIIKAMNQPLGQKPPPKLASDMLGEDEAVDSARRSRRLRSLRRREVRETLGAGARDDG